MSLELKSEIVETRQSGAASTTFAASDALFSLDLEGIVDMMDPNRGSFTVMELIAFKVDMFPNRTDNVEGIMLDRHAAATTANATAQAVRNIGFDTSVPDASQPTTENTFLDTDERWLASATKIVRVASQWWKTIQSDGTNDIGVTSFRNGTDFTVDWVDLRNHDGKGPLVAAPRLIVRLAAWIHSGNAVTTAFTDPDEFFQVRIRYKTRKISKNQMWQMLLQQTPGETLIRSGSAGFP